MSLLDDIGALRDRTLNDLNSAHDYFADTKTAWRIVRNFAKAGRTFSVRNTITGTTTSESNLVGKARSYISRELTEATFQQFISIFENYFCELLQLWLAAYPKSLKDKKIDFDDVLNASDKDAITRLVVNREVRDIIYGRPAKWFEYLEARVHLGYPSSAEIEKFSEAKASRDVLVHNRGIVEKDYLAKSGRLSRHNLNDRLEVTEQYHRETWELLQKMVADISSAAIAKANQSSV